MTFDLEMAEPEPVPTAVDPFALGWRYVQHRAPGQDSRVPLTEDDLVFPQEDDFVVNSPAHGDDRRHLKQVFQYRVARKPGVRVLSDHLIDFGHPTLTKWVGPDLIVLTGEPLPWDGYKAVFPLQEMRARAVFAVEITSPTTRRKDLTTKLSVYHTLGVPLLVIVDLAYGGGHRPHGILALQAGPTGYEPLPPGPGGRVWLEVVEVFLAAEDDRVVCYDPDGRRIPTYAEAHEQWREATARANAAKAETAAQQARTKEADAAAEAHRARADESLRQIAELQAEIRRLRGEPSPNP